MYVKQMFEMQMYRSFFEPFSKPVQNKTHYAFIVVPHRCPCGVELHGHQVCINP